jgi:hypothetical protein
LLDARLRDMTIGRKACGTVAALSAGADHHETVGAGLHASPGHPNTGAPAASGFSFGKLPGPKNNLLSAIVLNPFATFSHGYSGGYGCDLLL